MPARKPAAVGRSIILRPVGREEQVRPVPHSVGITICGCTEPSLWSQRESVYGVGATSSQEELVSDREVYLALINRGRTRLVPGRLWKPGRARAAPGFRLVASEIHELGTHPLRDLRIELE